MPDTLHHATDYREHRTADDGYPPPGDALDALVKMVRGFIAAGLPVASEAVAWVERCEAVKARYRKDPAP